MKKMTAAMAALGVVAGLGAAALPLASYASEATVPVTAIIDDALSITITDATSGDELGTDGVLLENVKKGGALVSKNVAVTVAGTGKYDLTLEDRLMDNALISANGDRIEALTTAAAGSFADAETELANSAWGYGVATTLSAAPETWKAVPVRGNADPITTGASASGSSAKPTTYVGFGVRAASTQEAGRYTSDVIFTATANS